MSEKITVQMNGSEVQLQPGATVSDLLHASEIRTHLVAVEVNLEIVPSDQHATRVLQTGDRVEAVTLVGGG